MYWKLKSAIQNTISYLPEDMSYSAYYWIQRQFGGLKKMNPVVRLSAGIETWRQLQQQGINPDNKIFFEVGTGRVPLAPLSYWLMGAKKVITIDLNPYLKQELLHESLIYMSTHIGEMEGIFGANLDQDRFEDLLRFSHKSNFTLIEFFENFDIDYLAPGDASSTSLPDDSIDIHTSYTVFEHIPKDILFNILKEGNRIIKKDGVFIHFIDYCDHFAYSDNQLSKINFLQYSDEQWDKYAGNRYMYMNRLRHDDYLNLYASCGHELKSTSVDKNSASLELLKKGQLKLDKRFENKSHENLSIISSWITSEKSINENK